MIEPMPIFGTTNITSGTVRAVSNNYAGVRYAEIVNGMYEIGIEEIVSSGDTVLVEAWSDGYYGYSTKAVSTTNPVSMFTPITLSIYSGTYLQSNDNDISLILKYIRDKKVQEVSNISKWMDRKFDYTLRNEGTESHTVTLSI